MAKEECAECKVLEDPGTHYVVDKEGKLCLSCTLGKLVFKSPEVDFIIIDNYSPPELRDKLRKSFGWDKELKIPSNNAWLSVPYIVLRFKPQQLHIGQSVNVIPQTTLFGFVRRPGGAAVVTALNADGSIDVKYTLVTGTRKNLTKKDFKVNRDQYLLEPLKVLGFGSYGFILEYYCHALHKSFIIKIEKLVEEKESLESIAIRSLDNLPPPPCGQIEAAFVGEGDYILKNENVERLYEADFFILEKMDGDIFQHNFVEEFAASRGIDDKIVAAVQIAEEVRKQILCIFNKSKGNLVYTDLKKENVLYMRNKGKEIIVKLGDLGSLIPIRNGKHIRHVFTYLCLPEKLGSFNEKKECLSYQLGLFLADLLQIDIHHMSRSSPDDKMKTSNKIRKELIAKLEPRFSCLADLLNPPETRRSIDESLVMCVDEEESKKSA